MSSKLLLREMDRLKERMLRVGNMAESQLREAIHALMEQDSGRAESVIEQDKELDSLEIEIEEDCLKILALHQPVASDLRSIVAILKMNLELERVGDLSVDICRRVQRLVQLGYQDMPPEIPEMARVAKLMLRKGLLSVLELDAEIAASVLEADARLDTLNTSVFESVASNESNTKSNEMEKRLLFMIIARRLERIGDHATNVAEDVIYICSGDIVRHRQLRRTERRNLQ